MNKWMDDYRQEVRNATDRMEMRSDVRRAPIKTSDKKSKKSFTLPKWSMPIGAVAACIVIVAIVLAVVLPGDVVTPPDGGSGSTPSGPAVTTAFKACVVETNPSVMFLLDDDLLVTDVKRLNSDAELLFSSDELSTVIGSTLESALALYTELLAKTGFIDVNSKDNAIRISGYGIENNIESARDKVRSTLSDKGIFSVVLTDDVDLTGLKSLLGLTSDEEDEDALSSVIESMKSDYDERVVESSSDSVEDLIAGYEERAYEGIMTSIRLNADRLISQGLILSELNGFNATIMISNGSPTLFGRYWDVKDKDIDPESDCAKIVGQMESRLNEFEEKFGYAIESQEHLNELTAAYAELKYDALVEALTNLSMEFVRVNKEILSRLMKLAGCDTTAFDALIDLPEDLDDYLDKISASYNQELSSRLEAYGKTFDEDREAISSSDYEQYLADIVDKYGSLEAYWTAIKNK